MRISTQKYDIGYSSSAVSYKAFVDGVEQEFCLTADTDNGFCIIADTTEDGKPIMNLRTMNIKHKIVFGNVTVEKI